MKKSQWLGPTVSLRPAARDGIIFLPTIVMRLLTVSFIILRINCETQTISESEELRRVCCHFDDYLQDFSSIISSHLHKMWKIIPNSSTLPAPPPALMKLNFIKLSLNFLMCL